MIGSSHISLIIPTLNASWELPGLLERIERQTVRPHEVLVVDSSSEDETVSIARAHEGVRVEVINRSDFNHGLTRHNALLETSGEFVCFMTQDAVPADEYYFAELIKPFDDSQVALSSGRQLPRPDARRFERLVREFNYGAKPRVFAASDIAQYGVKAFFATDVCSAYRRSAYLECGGFPELDISEDMYMAAAMIHAGYSVAYAPAASVYHSHNLTPSEQYRRNKAIGAFVESYRSRLGGADETVEGVSLVKDVASRLLAEGDMWELAAFALDCAARFAGNRAGRGSIRRSRVEEAM